MVKNKMHIEIRAYELTLFVMEFDDFEEILCDFRPIIDFWNVTWIFEPNHKQSQQAFVL